MDRWRTADVARRLPAFVGAIVMAAFSATPATAQAPARGAITALDVSRSLEATTRTVSATVVQIFATSFSASEGVLPRSVDLVTTERASGSGVIVDTEGYIVTNAHVVRGARRLRVEVPTRDGGQSILATRSRTVPAQLVGLDLETDLAVLKIDARNLAALPFGDSDDLRAGQLVLAFGSPLGLQNSVTLGVVSAVARQLAPESPMIYVQTDASINPGSSGGPLVDLAGRLVGINTLIVSQAGGDEGLGFAAPSNIVRTVYDQIRKSGRVRRGDIGVRPQTVTPVLAAGLRLPRDHGVVLGDVLPESPAARAGLRAGDLIISLDGKPMENGRQLRIGLYRKSPGDVVSLEIVRGRSTLIVPVTMSEREDPFDRLNDSVDPRPNLVPRLGVLGVDVDRRVAGMLPGLRMPSGIVVVSTVAGAIDPREGGLAPGDVIHAVNGNSVQSLAELRASLDLLEAGDAVVLQLERRGEFMYLAFTIE
jgi:serine protease Do